MEGNSKIHNSDAVYTVKNPGFVFILILLEIVGIAVFVFYILKLKNDWWTTLGSIAAITYVFFLIKAEIPGVVIDAKNDRFSFRGGGVSANNLTDYISPLFWLQSVRRFEYPLSSVSSVAPDLKVSVNNKGNVSTSYYLRIAGTFGSARISVGDERKLQELMSIFVNLLDMGVPVSNR